MAIDRLKMNVGERLLSILNYLLVGLFTFMCLYPFYYIIIYSISDASEAAQGVYFWPKQFDFTTYTEILSRDDLLNAVVISVLRTVIGTVLCIICSAMFAFLVTKKEMYFRKIVYRFVIISMYVGAGLIPWYLTMKAYGLKNNFLLYVLPGAVSAFFVILVKTYIEQLPASMEESASLDGAGFFTIFFKIIIPLSMPIIATIAVFCAVGQWNTWQDNYFLVSDPKLETLQLILYNYLNKAQSIASLMQNSTNMKVEQVQITPESVRMTIIVISVVPIMLVYPWLQKYFAKGIMMGAIKG